jgi:5-methylcytosine-specific restriction endonuclease McrA
MNVLNDKVLVINRGWQACDETSVAEALADMCSGKATGLDTATMTAVKWDAWLKLPIREGDRLIRSIRGPVRVPTVVGKFSYAEMPKRRPKLDNAGIAARDRRICQYTGEYAPDGSVDHVVALSKGGSKKSWTNMVWSKREVNAKKGNRTLQELGWKLLKKPVEPKPKPACYSILPKFDDWRLFLPQ